MGFSITMLSTEQPAQGNLCSNAAKRYMLSTAFVKLFPMLRVHVSVLKMACSSTAFPDGNVKSATSLLSRNILLSLLTPNWLPRGKNLLSRDLKMVWLFYCNSASNNFLVRQRYQLVHLILNHTWTFLHITTEILLAEYLMWMYEYLNSFSELLDAQLHELIIALCSVQMV